MANNTKGVSKRMPQKKNSNSFVKGDPRCNRNGRTKGVPNKTSTEIRNFLQYLYEDNLEALQRDLDKMNAFQRQQILDKISTKFLPTLSRTEIEGDIDSNVTIRVVYGDEDSNDITPFDDFESDKI